MTTVSSELDRLMLKNLREQIGEMSVDEALDLALSAEEIAKDCGPFDPAFEMFVRQKDTFFKYAVLLEKEANMKSPVTENLQ